jgi:stage II sporulation protein D
MGNRYSGTQKTVTITQSDLKSKDRSKYVPVGAEIKAEETDKNIVVKVLLERNGESITVASDAPAIIDAAGVGAARKFIFTAAADGNIVINGTNTAKTRVEITCPDGFLMNNRKTYRGNFLVYLSAGNLLLVNKIELEMYLYGVLPCEVSNSWEKEVLKAQAVAARSFAVYNRLKNKTPEYDLDSGVFSQVYKGRDIEARATNDAIDETAGEVLGYEGEVIQAFFHSNSGGKTASSAEVWGGEYKYLESVDDPYSANSRSYSWSYKINREKLSGIISKNKSGIGNVYDVHITDRTESNRVKNVRITGSEGELNAKGKDLRSWIGNDRLRSTNFTVSVSDNEFTFDGRGWGHGVGMSQEGAREMAKEGRTYKEILRYYYKNTKIKKVRVE